MIFYLFSPFTGFSYQLHIYTSTYMYRIAFVSMHALDQFDAASYETVFVPTVMLRWWWWWRWRRQRWWLFQKKPNHALVLSSKPQEWCWMLIAHCVIIIILIKIYMFVCICISRAHATTPLTCSIDVSHTRSACNVIQRARTWRAA